MSKNNLPTNFDPESYKRAYPDVAQLHIDPTTHYIKYGKPMGRDPNPKLFRNKSSSLRHKPALLDLQYTQGFMPSLESIRHDELVTIIIPSYNNENWLARSINSALSQQGVNVEVILVDDGSTDGSVKKARQIAAIAPNLKVISILRNFGCYYARNIGLLHSKGEFITILDSDDIDPYDRIARQLDAIKSSPGALACQGQQQRWTENFSTPISDFKYGESNLLWKREVIEKIGFYDTVRYSGDAEFRLRLQRAFGASAVVRIPDEVYFARTVEGSLTTKKNNGVFRYSDGKLTAAVSAPRKDYEVSFTKWQKEKKPNLKIPFPLFSRPFSLGEKGQNASRSLNQRCVGTMASFPSRRESLKDVLKILLPQFDEIRLYLNGYEEVPKFAIDPKIVLTLGKNDIGDLRDNGKFRSLPDDDDCYIFTLDDDIRYPSDYVTRMIHYIEMLGRACVVGVHGVIFPDSEFVELTQRRVLAYKNAHEGHFVDLLGTGTTAWHGSLFRPEISDFPITGVCDLWFALAAAKKKIPLFSVPREKNWLKDHTRYDQSLYQEALKDSTVYFSVYSEHLAPALKEGRLRREMETHLGRCYDFDTLVAAGISLPDSKTIRVAPIVSTRRSVMQISPLPTEKEQGVSVSRDSQLHFHVVINGWNCREYLSDCLRSVAQQLPDFFDFDVTIIDDHSDDGTYEEILRSAILPQARVIRVLENSGPAHARHVAVTSIEGPDTIVVLLDMDDTLEPHALRTVAGRYRENPDCLMTIGNWHDQEGKRNPQGFYSPEEIDTQRIREVELFNATHLRTFRRNLYNAVQVSDLLDQSGRWLETCTDVALMYALLDQCFSYQVSFIDEPIYLYNRKHGSGTLARFGKLHKIERLNWLKSKPPKPRPVKHRK